MRIQGITEAATATTPRICRNTCSEEKRQRYSSCPGVRGHTEQQLQMRRLYSPE